MSTEQDQEREIPQIIATIDSAVSRLEGTRGDIFKKTASVTRTDSQDEDAERKESGANTELGTQLMSLQKRIDIVNDDLFGLIGQIEL